MKKWLTHAPQIPENSRQKAGYIYRSISETDYWHPLADVLKPCYAPLWHFSISRYANSSAVGRIPPEHSSPARRIHEILRSFLLWTCG